MENTKYLYTVSVSPKKVSVRRILIAKETSATYFINGLIGRKQVAKRTIGTVDNMSTDPLMPLYVCRLDNPESIKRTVDELQSRIVRLLLSVKVSLQTSIDSAKSQKIVDFYEFDEFEDKNNLGDLP